MYVGGCECVCMSVNVSVSARVKDTGEKESGRDLE